MLSNVGPVQAASYNVTDLGILAGGTYSCAHDINSSGQIAGGNYLTQHAFIYSNGTMTELDTLGRDSIAYGINDSGQVVGGGSCNAFFYDGTMHYLGTFGGYLSEANDVNASGQVVGEAEVAAWDDHAFLYSNGIMTDLNTLIDPASGWKLTRVSAINDSGWIVGQGISPAGKYQAFLLTPTPEPSAIVLLATGLASFLFMAWRRRKRIA